VEGEGSAEKRQFKVKGKGMKLGLFQTGDKRGGRLEEKKGEWGWGDKASVKGKKSESKKGERGDVPVYEGKKLSYHCKKWDKGGRRGEGAPVIDRREKRPRRK